MVTLSNAKNNILSKITGEENYIATSSQLYEFCFLSFGIFPSPQTSGIIRRSPSCLSKTEIYGNPITSISDKRADSLCTNNGRCFGLRLLISFSTSCNGIHTDAGAVLDNFTTAVNSPPRAARSPGRESPTCCRQPAAPRQRRD